MSAELDVPLTPSADQIRRREFVTVRRGYDPDQVRQYLDRIADEIEVLEAKMRSMRIAAPAEAEATAPAQAEAPPAPVAGDPYQDLSGHMAELLRNAEMTADRIIGDAAAERDKMLAEAGAEADRVRTDAQGKAEAVRHEAELMTRQARAEADRLLSGLDGRREALVQELDSMRDRLLGMAHSLGTLAAEHEHEHEHEPAQAQAPADPDPRYAELWDEGTEQQPAVPSAETPPAEVAVEPEPVLSTPAEPEPQPEPEPEVIDLVEEPAQVADPLDLMFPDMPTLSLDDLDPGEFDR